MPGHLCRPGHRGAARPSGAHPARPDSGKFTGGDADWAGSNEAWQTGFVAGGGAEYALNNGAALRFEALYYNLGTIGATATGEGGYGLFAGTPITVSPYTGEMALVGMIVRGGITIGF